MACSSMLFPACASLMAAQLAASVPVEPETEATIADRLPDQFIKPDAEQIAIAKDRLERMTVSVRIEQGGPYAFIIDTASQRTIVSKEIAGALALDIEDEVMIVALAGSTVVQTVFVPSLTLGTRSYDGLISPTFRSANIGADGVLGLDSLQGQRILFDFLANQIIIEDAENARDLPRSREIVVTAKRRSGQLIFTDATIAGVEVNRAGRLWHRRGIADRPRPLRHHPDRLCRYRAVQGVAAGQDAGHVSGHGCVAQI